MSYGDYPDLSKVKKILVIKLRQLGDTLLTTPVFTALKAHLPHAQMDAYVYTESFPMLSTATHLIGYDRRWKKLSLFSRLLREFALWRRIRKEGYDLVINLTEGDRGALAARISGAPLRVGFSPKGRLQKSFYTHLVKHCHSPRHNVEKNLDALRRIGIFPPQELRDLVLPLQVPSPIQGPFILIHPTSRWKFKCWPVEKMRALTQELLFQGKKVVFTSGPDLEERAMVDEIIHGLPVTNLAGKISLKELAALIHESECLICVDSLPFHMASALKHKVVALFGPTSDISWGPWRNPHAQIVAQKFPCRPCHMDGCGGSKKSDCLMTLSVQSVLGALDCIENSLPVIESCQ